MFSSRSRKTYGRHRNTASLDAQERFVHFTSEAEQNHRPSAERAAARRPYVPLLQAATAPQRCPHPEQALARATAYVAKPILGQQKRLFEWQGTSQPADELDRTDSSPSASSRSSMVSETSFAASDPVVPVEASRRPAIQHSRSASPSLTPELQQLQLVARNSPVTREESSHSLLEQHHRRRRPRAIELPKERNIDLRPRRSIRTLAVTLGDGYTPGELKTRPKRAAVAPTVMKKGRRLARAKFRPLRLAISFSQQAEVRSKPVLPQPPANERLVDDAIHVQHEDFADLRQVCDLPFIAWSVHSAPNSSLYLADASSNDGSGSVML